MGRDVPMKSKRRVSHERASALNSSKEKRKLREQARPKGKKHKRSRRGITEQFRDEHNQKRHA